MLLQELLKLTHEDHPDFADLKTAVDLVSTVAMHINETVRRAENHAKVREVEALFSNEVFLAPSRTFVHSGKIWKKSRKGKDEYHVFLFNDLLVYASRSFSSNKLQVHNRLPIDAAFSIIDLADESSAEGVRYRFQCLNSQKSIELFTMDAKSKKVWTDSLNACVEAAATNRGHRSASVMVVKPVWKADQESKHCPLCFVPWGTLNRRHHCRTCGELCCAACSANKREGSNERCCDKCFYRRRKEKTVRRSTVDVEETEEKYLTAMNVSDSERTSDITANHQHQH
jgi:hypothetical protein